MLPVDLYKMFTGKTGNRAEDQRKCTLGVTGLEEKVTCLCQKSSKPHLDPSFLQHKNLKLLREAQQTLIQVLMEAGIW